MSLNQIIDLTPSSSLVVDQTLNLKAHQIRAYGDISAATFNGAALNPIPYSTTQVPFTIIGYDGTERAVTGSGITGTLTFYKIGKVVSVTVPDFQVTAFNAGGTNQFLRYKYNSPLPASLVPAIATSAAVSIESNSTIAQFPGSMLINGNDHIALQSDMASGQFIVSCGLTRPVTLVYSTA